MGNFIKIDTTKIDFAKTMLSGVRNGVERALMNAINRSLGSAQKAIYQGLKQDYALKKTTTRAKELVSVNKATVSNLAGRINFRGSSIPLINFSVYPGRPRKVKMVQVAVRRSGRKALPGAFVQTMKSGHVGVFERVGKGRYPLKQLYGPALPQMVNQVLLRHPQIQIQVQEKVNKELDGQIDRLFKGINAK